MSLAGLRLWVTRPRQQATAFAQPLPDLALFRRRLSCQQFPGAPLQAFAAQAAAPGQVVPPGVQLDEGLPRRRVFDEHAVAAAILAAADMERLVQVTDKVGEPGQGP